MKSELKSMYRILAPKRVEMSLCQELVRLQKRIWKMQDKDTLPAWKLFITPRIGNILIVCLRSGKPVGMAVLSLASDTNSDELYFYLDMVGVAPRHEGRGIARKMLAKAQRIATERKIRTLHWTYDPLAAKNANLYIRKLGASVQTYHEDYYPRLSGAHRAIPMDRFHAVALAELGRGRRVVAEAVIRMTDYATTRHVLEKKPHAVLVEIPHCFPDAKKSVRVAVRIRLTSRKAFQALFAKGYVIRGFERRADGNFYLAVRERP